MPETVEHGISGNYPLLIPSLVHLQTSKVSLLCAIFEVGHITDQESPSSLS
ncbi:MAG: hypothetical protein ABSD97_01595 [Acidimicrobiales bacterium]